MCTQDLLLFFVVFFNMFSRSFPRNPANVIVLQEMARRKIFPRSNLRDEK
jgi:hypothetical protein